MVDLHSNFAVPTCRPDRDYDLDPLNRDEPPCRDPGWNGLTAVLDLFTGQLIGWGRP